MSAPDVKMKTKTWSESGTTFSPEELGHTKLTYVDLEVHDRAYCRDIACYDLATGRSVSPCVAANTVEGWCDVMYIRIGKFLVKWEWWLERTTVICHRVRVRSYGRFELRSMKTHGVVWLEKPLPLKEQKL